ncbi:class I SAM-dependent methyltransferase [Bacillus sp. FJAT-47783]|uniref:class I SAM-dependent DNA methyltransferase n=1 Tax=Bacillus sp. FJAT-47783 TaxID=2922712 RepID=UPI001FAC9A1F|nr:class I SAM-dependent methyltransferase [Bacillus sp. FJAT-47783]
MYHHFAYIYDQLMKDAPYDDWVKFLHQRAENDGNGGRRVLDLACGTGEISYRLAKLGYHVTGVDLSEDMLAVAKEKMIMHGFQDSLFIKQDMRKLEGFQPFDYIFLCCDSLNYLTCEQDVENTFHRVQQFLKKDGLFIFDVHSVYKMEQLFKNHTFAYSGDEVSYIWNCFEGDSEYSVIHELTFFVRNGSHYIRYDEDHEQRTFSIKTYTQLLENCGFTNVDVSTGLVQTSLDKAERIFFVAKK